MYEFLKIQKNSMQLIENLRKHKKKTISNNKSNDETKKRNPV